MFKGPPDDDVDDDSLKRNGSLAMISRIKKTFYPKKEACVEMKIARTRLYNFVIII